MTGDETRLRELLTKRGGYTTEEVEELRTIGVALLNMGDSWKAAGHFRASVETIAAIKNFDRISTELISTTNRLTKWMLGFTIAAAVFALLALVPIYISLVHNSCH